MVHRLDVRSVGMGSSGMQPGNSISSCLILISFSWVNIALQDEETHGAMFAPVVLGSNKTTVSITTGQNKFYPLYASLGNVQNHVHHVHCNAVTVISFLAIPNSVTNFFSSLTHADHAFSFRFSLMIEQTFTTRQTGLLHMHTSFLHYDLHVFASWLTHFSYLFKPVVR